MHNFKHILSAAGLALSLATATLADDTANAPKAADIDTVVATVNGVEITVGHMILARATLPQQFQDLPPDVLFPGILDQLIQQTVLAQSFDSELPKRVTLAIENETRSLTAGEIIETVLQDAITEDAIKALYDADYSGADHGEEYNASHILVASEEEAKQIVTDLEGGADFADTAKEKSTGPSGPGGGSLGWFGTGMMVPEFEAAVIALEVGAVSAPVQTQFGWHVIKLNESRVKAAPALEEVRQELEGRIRQEAIDARIQELSANAEITRTTEGVDPSVITQQDLLD